MGSQPWAPVLTAHVSGVCRATTGDPAEEAQGQGTLTLDSLPLLREEGTWDTSDAALWGLGLFRACGTCCSRRASSFGLGHSRQRGEGYRSHSGLMNLRPGSVAPVQPL